ncbi:MAG: 2-oxoacid:acceptor oxidoreductase family protein [Candidatus Shikimatogenerans bostrichidophilus]|nr:MAG: 2-oxoacid:acceptor oxidoreductase family protein [Candidatus Shikimatogenerans bostrichidophilus]
MKSDINIILSGYSGEGIQFMGYHLSYILYINNYYIKTYNNIPSEILSPTKTITDLSEFIIRFSNKKINSYFNFKNNIFLFTNYISFKKNLIYIKYYSILILDFNDIELKKILKSNILNKIKYKYIYYLNSKKKINIKLKIKYNILEINRLKNSFYIGFLLYLLNLSINTSKKFLKKKLIHKKKLFLLNYRLLKLGYKIGKKNKILKINLLKNKLKSNITNQLINGNLGITLGLIFSSIKYNKGIFYSSYPITPSTSINYYLKKNLKYIKSLKIFDAEDEISAINTSIGASLYNKYIGVVSTSGPGMSLIQESLGLAVVYEIPLIIINVQRVGPSTGYPTKIEQSDLMQAIYGRHGEAPIPVFAIYKISNIIKLISFIFKLSFKLQTPIIILSDISISNNYSLSKKLKYYNIKINNIKIKKKLVNNINKDKCIGGLVTDINNHYNIIKKRQSKINYILNYKKINYLFNIDKYGKILIISWGSTYEIIIESINKLIKKKYKIGYIHFICLYPIQYELIENNYYKFKKIVVFELNNKQLYYIIKSYSNINLNLFYYNKMNGQSFTISEIVKYIKKIY